MLLNIYTFLSIYHIPKLQGILDLYPALAGKLKLDIKRLVPDVN